MTIPNRCNTLSHFAIEFNDRTVTILSPGSSLNESKSTDSPVSISTPKESSAPQAGMAKATRKSL